jgi:hypothetical protein
VLLLPRAVSVLPDDAHPLAQYRLAGGPHAHASGSAWAYAPYDVHSGECLLALAAGRDPPPGCI